MGIPRYDAEAVLQQGRLADLAIRLIRDGRERVLHCWGRNGPERELALASQVPDGVLPVFLGNGLGVAVEKLAHTGPVAVVDREDALLRAGNSRVLPERIPGVRRFSGPVESVLRQIRQWSRELGRMPHVVPLPFYLRLDPSYYRALASAMSSEHVVPADRRYAGPQSPEGLRESSGVPAWSRYPRFVSRLPRVLLLTKEYFLYREIQTALKRLGVSFATVSVGESERMQADFVRNFLETVARFQPDFVLTVNHFGLDREGKVAEQLHAGRLPLASWFVDSPELILHDWPGLDLPNVAVFSFDAASVPGLQKQGYAYAGYLPLATDPERFHPNSPTRRDLWSNVTFVGESLTDRVRGLAARLGNETLAQMLEKQGKAFAKSPARSPMLFLRETAPDLASKVEGLDREARLAAVSLLTFAGSRWYRLAAVSGLSEFSPLVIGDAHWPELLPAEGVRFAPRIDYYEELPGVYVGSGVNFNCTSAQMKGAVNQRVFDVPACGAFLLTDQASQLAELLEPGREIAVYEEVEDIPDSVRRWLTDGSRRRSVAQRARKRVLAQHTYEHRLQRLLQTMRQTFTNLA
ncbi:spore maturation protein CgeB [Paucidesulfovibrio gracilis DSM 16080]|uniref:Spore maturation protein CgeB n=1 Tax=Paucidesulfovibrio gracilis DSM 16080 TaxID=1121449 RepID=A0A1T4WIQ1_9BACT|nr:glycosyltransferase [Paucidesulfovibrio gracilis]SKA76765.1 spore maturation protein CgeB [Paucidesulfovibrio gracilis DSM 16080]